MDILLSIYLHMGGLDSWMETLYKDAAWQFLDAEGWYVGTICWKIFVPII